LGGSPEDAGWGNFREVCKETGVESVMIARAAESNLSCFRREGLLDPISEVIPKLLRIVSISFPSPILVCRGLS